jgi:TPR repeat protein
MYRRGLGTAAHSARALAWCRKAAEQGLDEAQYTLGQWYESGEMMLADAKLAQQWYQLAAAQGHAGAAARVAKRPWWKPKLF